MPVIRKSRRPEDDILPEEMAFLDRIKNATVTEKNADEVPDFVKNRKDDGKLTVSDKPIKNDSRSKSVEYYEIKFKSGNTAYCEVDKENHTSKITVDLSAKEGVEDFMEILKAWGSKEIHCSPPNFLDFLSKENKEHLVKRLNEEGIKLVGQAETSKKPPSWTQKSPASQPEVGQDRNNTEEKQSKGHRP